MTPIAVSIAPSDSSGASGVQGDLKTFSALGAYGASVVTALCAQNTLGIQAVHDVPSAAISEQIDAVFADLIVRALKIGRLNNPDTIFVVAEALDRYGIEEVVLDPVLDDSNGDAVEAMQTLLIPRALVITPNLAQAAQLLECALATDEDEMIEQADALLDLGPKAVLIKAAHGMGSEAVDIFYDGTEPVRLAVPRIATNNTFGAGAALSAAIAAGLSHGIDLVRSIAHAKAYVTQSIAQSDALIVGQGDGPVHHFHAVWGKLPLFGIEPKPEGPRHDNDD